MKSIIFTLSVIGMILSFQKTNAQAGSLDTSFNHTGKVTTVFASKDYAYAVSLQADGKIVAAGSSAGSSYSSFAVSRYNVNGTLDNTFGTGGKTINDLGSNYFTCQARSIVIQPDGKIVLAGYSTGGSGMFMLMRYKTDGIIDNTFGTSGIVTNAYGSNCYGVALQSDGKIVAAGGSYSGFTLARYNINGSSDNSFGSSGVVTTSIGSSAKAYSVAIQPDGKIVAAGASGIGASAIIALARYNTDGSLDNSFGTGGKVTTTIGSSSTANGVAIQTDGKIVVAGVSGTGVSAVFALTRYNTDGSLDTSFGNGGIVTTSIGSSGSSAQGVSIQADGKIVAAGYGNNAFAIARYNYNGTLDNQFGTGGTVTTSFTGTKSNGEAITIQADGKIVVAGYWTVNSSKDEFALARYHGASTIGLAEIVENNEIKIYPNPFNDYFTLESSQNTTIEIINTQGMSVLKKKLQQGKSVIDISALARGMYFIKVKTEKEVAVKKFIKE